MPREELDSKLEKVVDRVGRKSECQWQLFLWGLNLGGLRPDKSIQLSRDYDPECISPENVDESRKERTLPSAPGFVDLLLKIVQTKERHDKIFNPALATQTTEYTKMKTVSWKIEERGKLARVKVADKTFASTHDLRRSVGVRWSKLVSAGELRMMIHHEDIQTTRDYYTPVVTEDVAATLQRPTADAPDDASVETW